MAFKKLLPIWLESKLAQFITFVQPFIIVYNTFNFVLLTDLWAIKFHIFLLHLFHLSSLSFHTQ